MCKCCGTVTEKPEGIQGLLVRLYRRQGGEELAGAALWHDEMAKSRDEPPWQFKSVEEKREFLERIVGGPYDYRISWIAALRKDLEKSKNI